MCGCFLLCKKMREIENNIMTLLNTNNPIVMTEEDEQYCLKATHCYLCGGEIEDSSKVRDHCHITGKYRGCAHSICNINYNLKQLKIPVLFHNLNNYDAHLIISNAKLMDCKKKIDVIAQNSEKFITFGFDHLLFKYRFGFLSSSLYELVEMNKYVEVGGHNKLLDNWKDNFKFSSKSEYVRNEHDLNLLTEKGVFPYDYMDNWDRFDETSLPSKEMVDSELTKSHISDEDYERAKHVFDNFNLNNLGDYHDLYLTSDVMLLTDVFENCRIMCIDIMG